MGELITISGGTSPEDVVRVFDVSNEIFEKDGSKVVNGSPFDLREWTNRLENFSGEITYSQNVISGEVEAFAFSYQRSPDKSQLHVWIAGCKEKFRRNGIMYKIFEHVETRAGERGYVSITANTYPQKFVNMPAFLKSRKFEVVATHLGSPEPGDLGTKLAFKKDLL